MGVYATDTIERMAEDVLQFLNKTEPDIIYPPNEEWITLDKFHDELQKLERDSPIRYIEKETLLLVIGVLVGRNELECSRCHGRKIGYFYTIKIKSGIGGKS